MTAPAIQKSFFRDGLSLLSSILPGGRLSIMDRYLLQELILPLLFGIGMFSSLGVAIGVVFDLVRQVTDAGLGLDIALQVFLLKVPDFVVVAFPMSVMLATLMTYSRLSNDSELIALRSSGVSLYRLIVPAILLSLLVGVFAFAFNEMVVPAANYQAAITLEKALKDEKPSYQERDILYQEFKDVIRNGRADKEMDRLFYSRQFDGIQMKDLTILDFSQEGLNQIVTSKTASWNPSEKVWDFFNGTIYLVSPDGSYRNILRFEHQRLALPRAPLDLANRGRHLLEMNIAQSQENLNLVRGSGDQRTINRLEIHIQQRYAFPFISVVFGLVGVSMGAKPQKTGKATSFGISVLVIFVAYLLIFMCEALGQVGTLTPFLAAWLPIFIGLGMGGLLLVKTAG
ncbi:MAG: LptF/LptG family permease [Synechococcales cyanobacterium]